MLKHIHIDIENNKILYIDVQEEMIDQINNLRLEIVTQSNSLNLTQIRLKLIEVNY